MKLLRCEWTVTNLPHIGGCLVLVSTSGVQGGHSAGETGDARQEGGPGEGEARGEDWQ